MRIIIDIGHPAHVHYFKNLIHYMNNNGHKVFVSARDRFPVKELLEGERIPFYNRGKGRDSKIGKLMYMAKADFNLYRQARKFKPDILICFGAVYLTHVAKLLGKPSIFIDDTDNARLNQKFYQPFATHILTPDVFKHNLGLKQIRFKGYMELAYLHPRYFKPNSTILEKLGVSESEKYSIIRFVNWKANHDYGHKGITTENKIRIVYELKKYGKVFVTSEAGLPDELSQYNLTLDPTLIHHVMAFASLVYGESATMASEAAVLGVPSIYVDNDGRCYTSDEQNKYSLVYNFTESLKDQYLSIEKAVDIISGKTNVNYIAMRNQLLSEKISFSDYIIWLISNYPISIKTLQTNPTFQNKFIIPLHE